jgi:ketosteroid isomerase-like protein
MTSRTLVHSVAILVAVTFSAPALDAQSPVDSVRRLDSLWAKMYTTHDTATANRLYADDLHWTSVSGTIKDKRTELTDVAPAQGLVMEYFRTSGVVIREVGSAVVVTGAASWAYTMNGQRSEVTRRYTHVYARGGPLGWRIHVVHMGSAPRA